MSASDKKKLRKEQQTAALTEKQLAEKKQQKKMKAYTITFITAMVLVISIVLVSVLQAPITGLLMRNSSAVSVNDHKVDAAQFNYFYMDTINDFYNQFSSGGDYQDFYVQMYTGLDPTKSLDSQIYDKETGKTWADYFTDSAITSIKWTYAIYDAAVAANYKLSETEQKSLDSIETTFKQIAQMYGFANANAYLRSMYGNSANLKSYMEYYEITTIANSYASDYIDSLDFKAEDLDAFEKDKEHEFNSYSYAYYYVKADAYLTGGTTEKDENGKDVIKYTDEERKDAAEKALAHAKELAVAENSTVEKLNEAIKALKVTSSSSTATEQTDILYSSLPSIEGMADWLSSKDRKEGDITYLKYATHSHAEGEEHSDDEDETKYETVNGYYVVLYLGTNDNTMNVGTVRHLLVKWEVDEGKNEPTQAQKDAARAEAEKILAEFEKTDKSEKAFTELLTKYTDDINSTTKKPNNDGLYSDVTPASGYVKEFTKWACADHKKGDYEIIETEHGFHIMYFVEAAELNYRDTMIENQLIKETYNAWQEELVKKTTLTTIDLKYVDTDLIMSR